MFTAEQGYSIIIKAYTLGIGGLTNTSRCTFGGDSRSYQKDSVVFTTASHARGKEFHITLVEGHETLKVYGVICGVPGWSEEYGWLILGRWVEPIVEYIEELCQRISAYEGAIAKAKQEAEAARIGALKRSIDHFNDHFTLQND